MFILSCSHFIDRSYLAEMEQEDSSYFNPQTDFPIMAGDTGRYWLNDKERAQRTPSSDGEFYEHGETSLLRSELYHLEKNQSEYSYNLYNEHKDKFQSESEKIYFLKLPNAEKKHYLSERGFVQSSNEVYHTSNSPLFAKTQDVNLGMSKDHVLTSMGPPIKVEFAGHPRHQNERWMYRYNGATKYIYFESGQVQGWE